MSDRSGVEIDYCPQCRGLWLDRGELDKILERAVKEERQAAPPPPAPMPPQQAGGQPPYQAPPPYPRRKYDSDDLTYDEYKRGYGKRRKPWWMEIFD